MIYNGYRLIAKWRFYSNSKSIAIAVILIRNQPWHLHSQCIVQILVMNNTYHLINASTHFLFLFRVHIVPFLQSVQLLIWNRTYLILYVKLPYIYNIYSFRDNCIEYFMVSRDTKVKGPIGMVSKGMLIIDLRSKNCYTWLILRVC